MYYIDPDITRAETLPPLFYTDESMFEKMRSSLFANKWVFLGDLLDCVPNYNQFPFTLLPGFLNDSIVATRDQDGKWKALSNICTHRSSKLVSSPCQGSNIKCPYHGRRFSLDGKFRSMPGFEKVRNFPSRSDHLQSIPIGIWQQFAFVNMMANERSFLDWITPIKARMDFYPFADLQRHKQQIYEVKAHWALYCDNYLEGFHIPFVHPALNRVLSFPDYNVELFDQMVLQTGIAEPNEPTLPIPSDHPDSQKNIYAYYWWIFPNLMINFYPWGISLNEVIPITPRHTKIRYTYFLLAEHHEEEIIQTKIHETELEDETIVEEVQKGLESRHAVRGRFSPQHEIGVHYFHRLLADFALQNHK